MRNLVLIITESYLLGSIPFGYLLVRIVRGEDVRQSGSGNIGATNVSRKSPALGAMTLLLDALKGTAAVAIAYFLSGKADTGIVPYRSMALAAFLVILGHVCPVWLGFRGGKGVATALGAFALIAPKALLVVLGIFVVVLLIFRYVSLASILSVALFPLVVYIMHSYGRAWISLSFIAAAALLIVARHHENIRRLLAGTEHRFGAKSS
jgi:acyl phosphate:glycerol-3-phosphate acyltransferase